MQILDWQQLDAAARRAALARPAAATRRRGRRTGSRARSSRSAQRRRRRAAARLPRASIGAALGGAARERGGVRPRPRQQLDAAAIAAHRHRDRQRQRASMRAQLPAPLAWRRSPACAASGSSGRSVPSACTCRPGSAPLPSTVIMLAVPARLAGCPTARAVHAAGSAMAAPMPPCWSRRGCCGVDTRVQGRRRAGDRRDGLRHCQPFPRSTRSSAPAMPGSRRPSSWSRPIPNGAACDLPAGPSEVLVIADDGRTRRIRRRRPAGAGRARSERPGHPGHRLCGELAAAVATAVHRQAGQLSRGAILAALDRQHPPAGRADDLDAALAVSEDYAPEHLHHPDARAARAARSRQQCRFGLPRRLVTGDAGRLLLGHQPRAADLRLRARLQRPVGAGFHASHDGAGTRRPGAQRGSGRLPRCSRAWRAWTRMPPLSACDSRRWIHRWRP